MPRKFHYPSFNPHGSIRNYVGPRNMGSPIRVALPHPTAQRSEPQQNYLSSSFSTQLPGSIRHGLRILTFLEAERSFWDSPRKAQARSGNFPLQVVRPDATQSNEGNSSPVLISLDDSDDPLEIHAWRIFLFTLLTRSSNREGIPPWSAHLFFPHSFQRSIAVTPALLNSLINCPPGSISSAVNNRPRIHRTRSVDQQLSALCLKGPTLPNFQSAMSWPRPGNRIGGTDIHANWHVLNTLSTVLWTIQTPCKFRGSGER